MSECSNIRLGMLLPAYELGALPSAEIERFEVHLLQCDHCFDELMSFRKEMTLLKSDPEIRSITDAKSRRLAGSDSRAARIRGILWPKTFFILKPAVAYVLILLMIIPAYRGLRKQGGADIREISQTLELIPTRETSIGAFQKSLGELALLTFECQWAETGNSYHVTIQAEDGQVIYDNRDFKDFDWTGTGRLHLYLPGIKSGRYRLLIINPEADSRERGQEYYFRVEK